MMMKNSLTLRVVQCKVIRAKNKQLLDSRNVNEEIRREQSILKVQYLREKSDTPSLSLSLARAFCTVPQTRDSSGRSVRRTAHTEQRNGLRNPRKRVNRRSRGAESTRDLASTREASKCCGREGGGGGQRGGGRSRNARP